MTDTQNTATETHKVVPTNNYETIIFYAGMTLHITRSSEELITFGEAQDLMTPEMKDILFFLISLRVSMKRQKILGVVPVLQSYERLHPLFYRLSQMEDLYYTTEDSLLRMRMEKQHIASETEDLLMRQRDEIRRQAGSTSKVKGQNTAYEALKREYEVREAESK